MEPLENPKINRYTIFPIKDKASWGFYQKAVESFWVSEDVDLALAEDVKLNHWESLTPEIRRFLEHIIAFFAISDGIVNETLTEKILGRIQSREVKFFYDFQIMMEDIHNIVYSKLVDTYITNAAHKKKVFEALETYPSIAKKIKWVKKWLGETPPNLEDSDKIALEQLEKMYNLIKNSGILTFAENTNTAKIDNFFNRVGMPGPSLAKQILINTIMEGIFFSGSFCSIFWVYTQYGKLTGLAKANEFISRDEGLHTQFGVYIYTKLILNKLPEELVHQLITEAVAIEAEFIQEALPTGLLGMNAALMTQYIQFVADQLLRQLGYSILFDAKNPFPFMDKQSTSVRISDFFIDPSISEYGISSVGNDVSDSTLDFGEEF